MDLPINQIILGDCLEVLKTFPDKSVDLVVTSPPYDSLRDYKGYSFDFEGIAKELFRTIKDGGVVVWVVGDSVINGSESGTSFRQALFFKEVGFNLHDTMIYQKDSSPFPESTRYNQSFEYMFILSNGAPRTFNGLREATKGYKPSISNTFRNKKGELTPVKYAQGFSDKLRGNIWKYNVGYMKSTTDMFAFEHPATFPEKLASEHILSWSNGEDIVLDPFCGSGTTLKMAKMLGRNYIGIEISEEYYKLATERVQSAPTPLFTEKPPLSVSGTKSVDLFS